MSSQVAVEKLEQHTPGPWKIRGPQSNFQKGNYYIYPIQAGTTIMPDTERLIVSVSGKSWTRAEATANARLIAAAPDLLAALKIVDENISGFIRMGLNEAETETVAWIQNTVRSAIASAEGI